MLRAHMTLTLPLWFLPLLLTLASYMWALNFRTTHFADGVFLVFRLGAATIVSLMVWLIWALLT